MEVQAGQNAQTFGYVVFFGQDAQTFGSVQKMECASGL